MVLSFCAWGQAPPAPSQLLTVANERLRERDWRGAADALRAYLAQSPGASNARYQLALALVNLGQFAEAEQELRLLVKQQADQPPVLTALGMTLVRQKRAAEAVPFFERVERLSPASGLARLNTGVALADASQLPAAVEKFRQATTLEPKLLEAWRQLGRALLELRRFDEARAAHQQALALKPDDTLTLRQLGLLESLAGDSNEAAAAYERAVAAGAHDPDTLFKYGKALLDAGRREAGIAQLQRSLERDPTHRQALYALMRALAQSNPEQARQLQQQLQSARETAMAISRARLLANAALQAAQGRDWQSATAQLREAITLCGECPDRAALRRNLGLILAQAGDFAAAKTELRLAQQFDPNDRDTNLALAILERQR